MKIKSISVKNFKTFDSNGVYITFQALTGLVGENSSGKSNVLEAIDIFFNFSKGKIKKESFHHEDTTKQIEIEVTLFQLTAIEKDRFKLHLADDNESLTITQKIVNLSESLDGEESDEDEIPSDELNIYESKHGSKWTVPEDYEWLNCIDKPPTKTNLSKWWKMDLHINGNDIKSFFSNKQPSPEEYHNKIKELWNSGSIPKRKITGDDKILGWRGILKGNLPRYFLIPALKNLQDDLKLTKTSPFGSIISFLTNQIGKELKDEIDKQTKEFIDTIIGKIDTSGGASRIDEINRSLNSNLGIDIDCLLNLKFAPPAIEDLILPKLYGDDGFNSELIYKGHGMQRLAIFALLRTYHQFKQAAGASDDIIIGIEEPEIYLHSHVKRSAYNFFRDFSESGTQIIYTTHDSYFVKVENFDEIRLFRKEKYENTKLRTNVYEFSVDSLLNFYKNRYGKEGIDAKSLRHRFYHICDESKNEGFFAKKVIIIEGETEKYSLPIYLKNKGFDLDTNRISIISAGSVDTISYLFILFNEFKIPCYVIFDGDKPDFDLSSIPTNQVEDIKHKSKRNKELFTFIGVPYAESEYFFPETTISQQMAVWEKDFETVFHKASENYKTIKSESTKFYGTPSKPLAGRFFAEKMTKEYPDAINPIIDLLIKNIQLCEWKTFITKK
ncbi:ATP-dependent nuclease [Leptospira neocaledonica]|uniref:Uncharacterized protein n=1 Tax=Leptospira neocaledonica TaxID=2023192 RepID=A0A2M9ZZH2_9LEPT|nr:AAA family ATPase [Leptospira neocaledonica]PJZ77438.1 hypothetical protein CH365_07590 [Leptospira neocaledonica]